MEGINIQLGGLTNVMSDYGCNDGDVEYATNLVVAPDGVKTSGGYEVVISNNYAYVSNTIFVHRTENATIYVGRNETGLVYYDAKNQYNGTIQKKSGAITDLRAINSIGNILVITDQEGTHYFLLKYDYNTTVGKYVYNYLGNQLPNLDGIQFGLLGHIYRSRPFDKEFEENSISGDTLKFSKTNVFTEDAFTELDEDTQRKLTPPIMGFVNKKIRQEGVEKGRFIFPFFVRCALRLYDGSLTCHTPPIYMETASEEAVFLTTYTNQNGQYSSDNFISDWTFLTFYAHDLQYKFEVGDRFEGWEDIVKGVEIFVSAPIYTHDQDGLIKGVWWRDSYNVEAQRLNVDRNTFWGKKYSVCKADGSPEGANITTSDTLALYRENYMPHSPMVYAYNHFTSDQFVFNMLFKIGDRDVSKVKEMRNAEGTFYHLKSINLNELNSASMKTIEVPSDYLQSLVNRDSLKDDYRSNDRFVSSNLMVYNNRLHLGGVEYALWKGHHPDTIGNYVTRSLPHYWGNIPGTEASQFTVKIEVAIRENGAYYRMNSGSGIMGYTIPYFFYPNVNAMYLIVTVTVAGQSKAKVREIPLTRHPMLNGAYCSDVNLYDIFSEASSSKLPTTSSSEPLTYGNQLASSEVDNPFVFRAEGYRTIGSGSIFALKNAATPMSQGQFGQYPVYAFTTEGVYALPTKENGLLGVESFVSPDVPEAVDKISYVDGSVVYPTERGMRVLSGADNATLSESLTGIGQTKVSALPKFEEFFSLWGSYDTFQDVDYRNYLSACYSVHDPKNKRIIFFNEEDNLFHLVYYTNTQKWGVCPAFLKRPLMDLQTIALSNEGEIIDYSVIDESSAHEGLLVTRPIKLGSDSIKKLRSVEAVGDFDKGSVRLILWGSRDLKSWFLVKSSNTHKMRNILGTGYRYYRVGVIMNLHPYEVVTGLKFQ